MRIKVRDVEERFRRTHVPDGPDPVLGKFFFTIDITADAEDLYVPLSIASGKKPTGFVYHLEGTAAGSIKTTDITCRGDGITQVTLGTLVYCKIPKGLTATFRIRVEMRGHVGKSYRVIIHQIHYKLNPADTRYQKSAHDIGTKMLKFS